MKYSHLKKMTEVVYIPQNFTLSPIFNIIDRISMDYTQGDGSREIYFRPLVLNRYELSNLY